MTAIARYQPSYVLEISLMCRELFYVSMPFKVFTRRVNASAPKSAGEIPPVNRLNIPTSGVQRCNFQDPAISSFDHAPLFQPGLGLSLSQAFLGLVLGAFVSWLVFVSLKFVPPGGPTAKKVHNSHPGAVFAWRSTFSEILPTIARCTCICKMLKGVMLSVTPLSSVCARPENKGFHVPTPTCHTSQLPIREAASGSQRAARQLW